jgi:hypothetical protein
MSLGNDLIILLPEEVFQENFMREGEFPGLVPKGRDIEVKIVLFTDFNGFFS